MSQGITMSYSESFKQKVISEIESGKYSKSEARRVYGIKGGSTISYWLKKYGKSDLLDKVVRVETANEKDRIKQLSSEKKELEQALSQAYLKILRLESTVAVAEQELGYKLEKKSV